MRKQLFILSLLLTASLSAQLKIGVISDTHYLSDRLMDGGYAVEDYMLRTGRMIKYGPQILDSVIDSYLKARTDILLVCGDITKDGEKESHIDFVNKLKPLQEKGTKIFVVPGNHDINMPVSLGYIGNKTYKTENITSQDFVNIYSGFGYRDAIMRDAASLSYVASLDAKTWLLAIDAARYNEYETHSLSGGRISVETENWINAVLEKAKSENVNVLGMMHWGLTEHFPFQSILLKDYLVNDWSRLSASFADKGLKVIFTGHCHANDITAYTSDAGNTVYDVETGSLCSYPFSYRLINYYPDKMEICTQNITSVADNRTLSEDSRQVMLNLAKNAAKDKIKAMSMKYSQEVQDLLSVFMAQVFLLHVKGDEVITPEMKEISAKLSQMTDGESGDITNLEIELPPADNNVTIHF